MSVLVKTCPSRSLPVKRMTVARPSAQTSLGSFGVSSTTLSDGVVDLRVRRSTWTLRESARRHASDDLAREAVATLEDTERIARRVLGGAHPLVVGIEKSRGASRAPRPRDAVSYRHVK